MQVNLHARFGEGRWKHRSSYALALYSTKHPYCEGVSDSSGQAACSRGIGAASAGYQVNITVRMDGHEATTWFTPQ